MGGLELPNRIIMAPMTRNRAGPGNAPRGINVEYYRQRASAGFIVTEGTQVSQQGMGYPSTPGIHSPEQVAGWREVTDAVHAADGRIFAQLWHVGRISHPSLQPGGAAPVAPSAIAAKGDVVTLDGLQPLVTPRALETHEMADIVAQFRNGAECARAAGFDGVEIHGANGYLLDQFTRDGANRRDDSYGGPVANRIRLPLAVADAVIDVWGADRVGYRISPFQGYNTMSDGDPEATFTELATELERRGIIYLHAVEAGDPHAAGPDATADDFVAARAPLFSQLREIFTRTLIVNAGYDAARAEAVISSKAADLVAIGKPFISNPDLPRRFATGAALAETDNSRLYGGDAEGYIDYPALQG